MVGRAVEVLDTPSLVVDLDAFEANLRLCAERLAGRVALRPHLKTAKSPAVAQRLLACGAHGICVAKLGEAEVMLEAGVPDVLVTTELVGAAKVARFARLARSFGGQRLSSVVDSAEGAQALDAALGDAGCDPVDVLIDVNVGQDRCGVEPGDAAALADRLRPLERLRLAGVQGYEGHLQHVRDPAERRRLCDEAMERLGAAVRDLRAHGHAVGVVTTGGTGTAEICAGHEAVTEVQPGSFAFMDADYLATGGLDYVSSLTVLATVVSRPAADRAIVDAGLKSLSDDSGPAVLLGVAGWTYRHAGDEHGVLRADASGAAGLRIGDRVSLLPSHVDTTVNLHDLMYAQRGGTIEEVWPIAARGRVR